MDIKKNLKVVIFDFDGTLVDLKTDYASIRLRLKAYFSKNFEIEKEFKPIIEDIEACVKEIRDEKKAKMAKKTAYGIIEEEELKAANEANLKNNAKDVLDRLSSKYKIAIVTRNGEKIVKKIFEMFGLPELDLIVARESVAKQKPSKDQLEKVLKEFGVSNKDVIFIGDSKYDIEAGRKSGISTFIADGKRTLKKILSDYL